MPGEPEGVALDLDFQVGGQPLRPAARPTSTTRPEHPGAVCRSKRRIAKDYQQLGYRLRNYTAGYNFVSRQSEEVVRLPKEPSEGYPTGQGHGLLCP